GAGVRLAGICPAYRPPVFGVGGFADKFHSLHTYGLAVDVTGIGAPGTPSALLWHEIASRNGVICPYGPHNLLEWNHCQPTWVKIILADNPLRETVTAGGPISLEDMFEVGYPLIAALGTVGAPPGRPPPSFFKPPKGGPWNAYRHKNRQWWNNSQDDFVHFRRLHHAMAATLRGQGRLAEGGSSHRYA